MPANATQNLSAARNMPFTSEFQIASGHVGFDLFPIRILNASSFNKASGPEVSLSGLCVIFSLDSLLIKYRITDLLPMFSSVWTFLPWSFMERTLEI